MNGQWHYSQDGAQYGPVDESEVIRLIQAGEIPPGAPVCAEGGDEWRSAREYDCFKVEVFPAGKMPTAYPATPPAQFAQTASHNPPQPAPVPAPPSSPAPIVMNPALAPVAAGKSSMSGAAIACLVIMIIITIGSVCFSVLQSQKLNETDEARESAVSYAKSKQRKIMNDLVQAKNDLLRAKGDLGIKTGDISRLTTEINSLQGRAMAAINQAKNDIDTAQFVAADAQAELRSAQIEANKLPALQTLLAQYEVLGTPAALKTKLAEWERLQAGAAPPPTIPKPKGGVSGEVAKITAYQSSSGGLVLNQGSSIGIKVGDKFTLFRGDKVVGKIIIRAARPTVAIAIFDPAYPKPSPPFQSGDKVVKLD